MTLEFKNKLKHLALLDAIIEPEWEYRYYSYNSKWGDNEEMSSLRDSCGGEWFILFFGNRVAFKCTSPEDGLAGNFEEIKNSMPIEYYGFISEPAFSMDIGSCIWYLEDNQWVKLGVNISDLPNPGTIQDMTAKDYCNFAQEIYEKELDLNLVETIFNGNFALEMATKINPEVDLTNLESEIKEIGINL